MGKKIRLLFDADPLAQPQMSGVGYYSRGFLCALADHDPDNIEVVCHYFDFLGGAKPDLPARPNIKYRRSIFIHRKAANQLRRMGLAVPMEILTKCRGDFMLFPNFLARPSLFKTPYAPVIHDLTYIDQPDVVSRRNRNDLEHFVPQTIGGASFLITVSDFTSQRISSVFGRFKKRILVGHIPARRAAVLSKSEQTAALGRLNISKPYILFLGTLEPRKNLDKLIEAYKLLPKSLTNKYSLVLAGSYGWNSEGLASSIEAARGQGLRLVTTGYVSDQDRSSLLSGADLVVLPSVYEGYGMPLVEAMAAERAVAASDISVLREITGGTAAYFDPANPDSIANTISSLLEDSSLRKKQIAAGKLFVDSLSWTKLIEDVVDQIHKTLEQK